MTPNDPARAPARGGRARLRALLVVAGVAVAVAGIGGTTGMVIGGVVAPASEHHRHYDGHHRFDRRDGGAPAPPPGPVSPPAAPAPAAPVPP